MDTYTLDANGLLYYLVDALPRPADDVFRAATGGTAVLQLPAIAAAEALYVVRNRDDVADVPLQGGPDDVVEGLDSHLPVTVVSSGLEDLAVVARWMDRFPRQVHDALVVASHVVNDTDAVVTRDPEVAEYVPTVWD